MKQFMQTLGLQIDDVSWTPGRTQTIRYANKYGTINFQSVALNYTVYVDRGLGYVLLSKHVTGILMFNMPITDYSLGNNYHEKIVPLTNRLFIQQGTSAPVCHIFVTEKMPMNDGSYIRVVAAPSVRMLNSTLVTGGVVDNYIKFYLPTLNQGLSLHQSQSTTLFGNTVTTITESNVNKVKISISAPKASLGFDLNFFGFDTVNQEIDVPNGSVIQFYIAEVTVSIGLFI